jgi:Fe-S-cluster containining protein
VERPFYHSGLKFECTRCSRCCRHTPGFVFLSKKDLEDIASYLGRTEEAVRAQYCRVVTFGAFRRLSLKEKPNLDCVFWEDGGCAVYPARPLQCRSFPFWAANLESREAWKRTGASCPGIGRGKLHSGAAIERWLHRRKADDPLEPD